MLRGNDNPHRRARLSVRALAAAFALAAALPTVLPAALPAMGADFAKGVAAYDAKDYATALKEWLPLAKDGDPAAQRNIGHLYRRGLGVKKDPKEAIKWYRAAAEQGFDRAQANLAYMYLNGNGVQRDFAKAAEWFYRAAIQGHPIAQFNLGQMYQLGWGVPKDRGRAMAWYNLAAKAGHKKALDRLSVLVLQTGPPELVKDGGTSLPAEMPDGEPGWDKEPMKVATAASKMTTETADAPPPRPAAASVQKPSPSPSPAPAPVQRAEESLPKDEQVVVAKLAPPPAEPAKPAASDAPTAAETARSPAKAVAAETGNPADGDAKDDDDSGFFSRIFSWKAPTGQSGNSGPRENPFGVMPHPYHASVDAPEPAPRPADKSADAAPDTTPTKEAAKEEPTKEHTETAQAVKQVATAKEPPAETAPVKAAPAPKPVAAATPEAAASVKPPAAPAKPAKSWVNPDTLPVATATQQTAPVAPVKAPVKAPVTADQTPAKPAAAPAHPKMPAHPKIKITVDNPPPDNETVPAKPAAPAKKEKKGFFARLFGGSDSDADTAAGTEADAQAEPSPSAAAKDTPVVDLTALPEDATPTDPTATDLAPKVKSVQITALTPPPSDKVPADAAQADGTVTEKVNGEANGDVNRDSGKPVKAALRQVATIAPMIPIPEPATGPTERDAKDVVAQKTASAGQPRQLADDNPREFFAPKVTIDWNTVLKPSASYSSPAAENKAAKPGKGDKPKSLADSGQEALTALAAKEGLIEPLQLGLLAYRARDYKTAIKYWLPMAHEGKSRAQFYMGGLYHDGTGVERDMVQAYMWWSLAAAKGYNPALTARDRLRDDMTDVEVAEAMNLVRTWRPVSE